MPRATTEGKRRITREPPPESFRLSHIFPLHAGEHRPLKEQAPIFQGLKAGQLEDAFLVYQGGKGSGKELALDTPVLTTDGWSTQGALEVGQCVFDERGESCRIVGLNPVHAGLPCWRLRFSDGSSIVCSEDHLWLTWTHAARKAHKRRKGRGRTPRLNHCSPQVRTTREIVDTPTEKVAGTTTRSATQIHCDTPGRNCRSIPTCSATGLETGRRTEARSPLENGTSSSFRSCSTPWGI